MGEGSVLWKGAGVSVVDDDDDDDEMRDNDVGGPARGWQGRVWRCSRH